MPWKNKEQALEYRREWARRNRKKQSGYNRKWVEKNRDKKRAANRKCIGEPGSPERERYNEKRRIADKRACLAELEALREHKRKLHDFIRSKAA